MSVQVKGSGTIGGLDEGLVVSGIVTSSTQVNVGSNIKLGNAGVVTATSFVGSGANLTSLPSQLTLSNNADNRVITGGSGTNLNGEANLTFDGSTLDIFNGSNSSTIKLKRHASTASQQAHIGYFSSGLHIETREATFIALKTNTNERLHITSTGILVTGGGTAPSSTDVGSIFMPGGGDLGWLTSSGSITFNAYYNGGWKYVTTGTSHILWASSEGFNFSTASSGSANGAISYSRAMKIFTNNRISIGDGNSGTPLGALHIDTKSTTGTDTALWIGDNANKRYLAINQTTNSEQFSEMKLQFNDNGTRSVLKLSNPYAPAGYGTAILWQGYNDGQQGMILCQSENANSAAATMYLNSSSGTFLRGNSSRHVTMPQQPSFAAYRNASDYTVNAGDKFIFNTTRHNVGSHFDTSNSRFNAPVAGSYQINFFTIYRGNVSSAYVRLYKNGSRLYGGDIHFTHTSLGSNWDNVSFSQVVYLSQGDYLEIYNGMSGNIVYHGNHWQLFSGWLLG